MCELKKVLLVEDLPQKADEIKKIIHQNFPDIIIVEKSTVPV